MGLKGTLNPNLSAGKKRKVPTKVETQRKESRLADSTYGWSAGLGFWAAFRRLPIIGRFWGQLASRHAYFLSEKHLSLERSLKMGSKTKSFFFW